MPGVIKSGKKLIKKSNLMMIVLLLAPTLFYVYDSTGWCPVFYCAVSVF